MEETSQVQANTQVKAEVNPVQNSSPDNQVSNTAPDPESRKSPAGKIVLTVLLFILAGGIYGYFKLINPYIIVGKATAKLGEYDSASVIYKTEDESMSVTANLAGEKEMSQVTLEAKAIGGDSKYGIQLETRVNEEEMFLKLFYSQPEMLDRIVKETYPPIVMTQTYGMAKSLWQGDKWLHIPFPETGEVKEEMDYKDLVSTGEGRKIAWDWFRAVKPRKVVRGYEFEGEKYTKVSFGFRKAQLIKAIDDMKDMDIDVKVSQINAMVDAVRSSDDWDNDLFTFLIDRKGDLRIVELKMPTLDEEVWNDSITQGVSGEGGNPMFGGLAMAAKNMVVEKEAADLTNLGNIRLENFDQVKPMDKPVNLVEADVLMATGQRELGPIIGQMISASSQR